MSCQDSESKTIVPAVAPVPGPTVTDLCGPLHIYEKPLHTGLVWCGDNRRQKPRDEPINRYPTLANVDDLYKDLVNDENFLTDDSELNSRPRAVRYQGKFVPTNISFYKDYKTRETFLCITVTRQIDIIQKIRNICLFDDEGFLNTSKIWIAESRTPQTRVLLGDTVLLVFPLIYSQCKLMIPVKESTISRPGLFVEMHFSGIHLDNPLRMALIKKSPHHLSPELSIKASVLKFKDVDLTCCDHTHVVKRSIELSPYLIYQAISVYTLDGFQVNPSMIHVEIDVPADSNLTSAIHTATNLDRVLFPFTIDGCITYKLFFPMNQFYTVKTAFIYREGTDLVHKCSVDPFPNIEKSDHTEVLN